MRFKSPLHASNLQTVLITFKPQIQIAIAIHPVHTFENQTDRETVLSEANLDF